MSRKSKKAKVSCWVDQAALQMLAVGADTEGVAGMVVVLAQLVAERTRTLAREYSPAEWELMARALDNLCFDGPAPGTTWGEAVEEAVEGHIMQVVYGQGVETDAVHALAHNLLVKLCGLPELDAVCILAAVRFSERLGPEPAGLSGRWWEPAHRLRQPSPDQTGQRRR